MVLIRPGEFTLTGLLTTLAVRANLDVYLVLPTVLKGLVLTANVAFLIRPGLEVRQEGLEFIAIGEFELGAAYISDGERLIQLGTGTGQKVVRATNALIDALFTFRSLAKSISKVVTRLEKGIVLGNFQWTRTPVNKSAGFKFVQFEADKFITKTLNTELFKSPRFFDTLRFVRKVVPEFDKLLVLAHSHIWEWFKHYWLSRLDDP